jgi:hypothetical protein
LKFKLIHYLDFHAVVIKDYIIYNAQSLVLRAAYNCATDIANIVGQTLISETTELLKGAANHDRKLYQFNVRTEAGKVLNGEPTKVSRESLLHALADRFVAAHSENRKV